MRAVLDTNVLVSAIFFSGTPFQVLDAWLKDRFDLVVSTEILEEYRRTAGRLGEEFPDVDVVPVINRIALHALLVVPARLPDDACADRDDIKFLECALAARAECVISGDRALLRASGYRGIKVVTPRRFLETHLRP